VSYGSVKCFERFGRISIEALLKIAEAINRLDKFEGILIPNNTKRLEKLFIS